MDSGDVYLADQKRNDERIEYLLERFEHKVDLYQVRTGKAIAELSTNPVNWVICLAALYVAGASLFLLLTH